jgi:hypothetical protein
MLILFSLAKSLSKKQKNYSYSLKGKTLITDNEKILFNRLHSITIKNNWLLFCQVDLKQVIQANQKNHNIAFGKICQKSFDFLICDMNTAPLLAIELDDRSHERADRKQADAEKDYACKSAKLPLLRIKSNNDPELEQKITAEMTKNIKKPTVSAKR